MNIYDYLDNYGMYTFEEKSINLVDKVIFSFLYSPDLWFDLLYHTEKNVSTEIK